LQQLQRLLVEDNEMSSAERHRIKSDLNILTDYVLCYQLTEVLIQQLKTVSPAMYMQIDSIKDKKGRSTDVYVKLIRKENATIPLRAATFFEQSAIDEDANTSIYGQYSVAVDIWIADNALFLLSHELGHVNYIVPNLSEYSKFYKRYYHDQREVGVNFIGHHAKDPGGKSANAFEKRFIADRTNYLRQGGQKPEAMWALLIKLKRNAKNEDHTHVSAPMVSVKPVKKAYPSDEYPMDE
jgi:hypothetical protein